ncbi:MAG: pre-16S rRNA-processing nuclease YqgF [Acidaminococcaceae bacterium]
MSSGYLLGIDPGSSKTGAALLSKQGEIIRQDVILMNNFAQGLAEFLRQAEPEICVIGNGTTSQALQDTLAQILPNLKIVVADEAHSTEEARTLYWELNPPQGWRRFMPLGMLTPPVPLDAYAAVVLARRFLQKKNNF